MRRSHITDYASHAIAFYARNQDKRGQMDFRSEAEKLNWDACARTMRQYSPAERKIILEVYSARDTFADNVYQASVKHHVPQERIWKLVDQFLRQFAQARGLI